MKPMNQELFRVIGSQSQWFRYVFYSLFFFYLLFLHERILIPLPFLAPERPTCTYTPSSSLFLFIYLLYLFSLLFLVMYFVPAFMTFQKNPSPYAYR
ncbi:MAG: hypothetical protein J3R72DRAFT_59685 [Linnemannia gamsii]|nr:MAG: hypothetical protein J3R72DRAFT_59685 [Linnemannia gamsii]